MSLTVNGFIQEPCPQTKGAASKLVGNAGDLWQPSGKGTRGWRKPSYSIKQLKGTFPKVLPAASEYFQRVHTGSKVRLLGYWWQ